MDKSKILFSVIIPTFNAKRYLGKCISSILNSTYSNYEIIVVDNGSTDGSLEYLKKTFSKKLKKINFVVLDKNYGPARARNEGAKVARGKYFGFLDSDTEVKKDWMTEALKCFEKNKKAASLQCKLLLMSDKNRYDYAGEYLGSLGFLVPVVAYGEKDCGQHDSFHKIIAAKSAGMFIRKNVFEDIGGFDEDYFIFMEETDLGWRCWLSGYEVIFCPHSIVYHHFSATKNIVDKDFNNYLVRFHGTKNYIMTLAKNLGSKQLVLILPKHIVIWISFALFLIVGANFRSAINVFKGIIWDLAHFPQILAKRKKVQQKRKLTDDKLFRDFGLMKKKSLLFFIKRFASAQGEVATPED